MSANDNSDNPLPMGCTNCGSFSHVRNQCPLPSPAKQRNALTPAAQTPPHAALSATQPAQAAQSDAASEAFSALADAMPFHNGWVKPQAAQGAGEVVRDYYQELLTARGAVQELEQKVFSQEQAIAILRTCVASHQRDMADPPAYLQDAVIKAAGLGAMAEQIAELKRQATHTPTQPAAGADVKRFTKNIPTEQGWYWHWNGDEELAETEGGSLD